MSNRHNYDLTGTWKGYNRHGEYIANYYIRQTEAGSSVQIHWIGLSRDPDYFSETFYGNRVGDLVIKKLFYKRNNDNTNNRKNNRNF